MIVELPYEIGTYVKVIDTIGSDKRVEGIGSVAAYTVSKPGDYMIWVSGYKESWCGEYLPNEVIPLSEEEIKKLYEERGLPSKPTKEDQEVK